MEGGSFLLKTLLMKLWRLMILLEMVLKVVIGVMVMEVDKMADEVTDMEVDKVTDMKIPIEDLTDVILAIGDTYRDDVRSVQKVGRHVELIQVMPPVSQIFY